MRLTIDTNCINIKQKIAAVNTLERWETEGKVKLSRTQRSLSESRHEQARQKMLGRPNVGEPAVWDVSFLDSDAYLAPPGPQFDELFSVLFPTLDPNMVSMEHKRVPDGSWTESSHVMDVMHLLAHESSGNQIFVTHDKDFLRCAQVLREKWNVVVMSPEDAVAHLQSEQGWT